MANSNSSTQHVEESSSKTHDSNQLADPSSPKMIFDEVHELSFLQEIISPPGPAEEDLTEGSISATLKQLETADSVAKGVESKLDKLLENLEGLLEGLEGVRGVRPEDGMDESDINFPGSVEAIR